MEGVVICPTIQVVITCFPIEVVGALCAIEGVIAGSPVDKIGSTVACDIVVEGIAGATDGGGAGQVQPLEVRSQGEGYLRIDRIIAAGGAVFGDGIQGGVDTVGVVAVPPYTEVVADCPYRLVVAVVATEEIIADIAVKGVVAPPPRIESLPP